MSQAGPWTACSLLPLSGRASLLAVGEVIWLAKPLPAMRQQAAGIKAAAGYQQSRGLTT